MAKVGRKRSSMAAGSLQRVSPLKPGLRGARNWATAQLRAAGYSREGMWRLVMSGVMTMAAIVLAALWLGGFLGDARTGGETMLKNRLIAMGFTVERIDVVGEGRLDEGDVRAALGVNRGEFLFDLDLQAAQARVEALSWVESAVVRRLWPDRIVVQIMERQQFALWQHEGRLNVIDASGAVIHDADPSLFPGLPLLVGEGAKDRIPEYKRIQTVAIQHGFKIEAFIFHETNRWDVKLAGSGVFVKLPKDDVEVAFRQLANLNAEAKILARPVNAIDLRLPDRVTLVPASSEPA